MAREDGGGVALPPSLHWLIGVHGRLVHLRWLIGAVAEASSHGSGVALAGSGGCAMGGTPLRVGRVAAALGGR